MHSFRWLFYFLITFWVVYGLGLILPIQTLGIRPRSLIGLIGILLGPFIHGNFQHLISNSLSFLILGFFLAYFEKKKFPKLIVFFGLVGGFLTWLIGGKAIHIGASGLIFGMLGYLLVFGFFHRKLAYIFLSLVIGLVYGGMLWNVLPSSGRAVSWESHLFGLLSGVLAARLFVRRNPAIKTD